MTYIYDMAGGTEYQGEALNCPKSSHEENHERPAIHAGHQETALQLVPHTFAAEPEQVEPGWLDLDTMIKSL